MKVTLLNHAINNEFNEYEHLVEQAAAICVDKLDNPTKKGMMNALDSGHLSIIEHLPLTFLIEDVSRALTHQLVRHRIASYSQQSQRYTKVKTTNENWFIFPYSIQAQGFGTKYLDFMNYVASLYNEMCEAGIPNEDARMILPNACFTSIIVTMNARSFIEQCQKRICNKAQWEIREMYTKMRELIKDIYPTVYKMSVPKCVIDKCPEKKPCGNPYEEIN